VRLYGKPLLLPEEVMEELLWNIHIQALDYTDGTAAGVSERVPESGPENLVLTTWAC